MGYMKFPPLVVPLFLKNKLRCSPKFTFTEFPCSQKLCSMFPWSPKIFLTVPHNFSHISFSFSPVRKSLPCHYFKKVPHYNRETNAQVKTSVCLLLFTQYDPALLPSLKTILMGKWCLIQSQQRLIEIFKKPPVIQLSIQLISAGVVWCPSFIFNHILAYFLKFFYEEQNIWLSPGPEKWEKL